MPVFKTNLDIRQNQLMNAVLHNLPDFPQNPVEGQLFFNSAQFKAYIWNGTHWIPWGSSSSGGGSEVRQFITTILNPSPGSGAIMIRLYEDLIGVRVDAHFSTEDKVYFNIETRENVNQAGTNITDRPMTATYDGSEYTTIDHPLLDMDDWLYLSIVSGSGDDDTSGEGGATGGTGAEPPAGNGEILGILTVILTCIIN